LRKPIKIQQAPRKKIGKYPGSFANAFTEKQAISKESNLLNSPECKEEKSIVQTMIVKTDDDQVAGQSL
jgi:hypothetical protein